MKWGDLIVKIEIEKLYQWDLNRTVKIIPDDGVTIDTVNFHNPGDFVALVVDVESVEGGYIANIPNILLKYPYDIVMYVIDNNQTKSDYVFEVEARQRPADYVYTETEIKTYANLEKRIKALEDGGSGGGGGSITVDDKLSTTSKNPVQNKVIATVLNGLSQGIDSAFIALKEHKDEYEARVNGMDEMQGRQAAKIANLEQNKQDKLTFDSTPTEGSSNPVTSGGVKAEFKEFSKSYDTIISNAITENKQYTDNAIGDISTALTELHNYAEALKGGEA